MGNNMPLTRFKDEHPFEKRVEEADKIRKKHADQIPVICEKAEGSDIAEIDRKKYLVPQELPVGQFMYVVRKRLRLLPEKALFIFVDGHLPSSGSALMTQLYKDYKDPDGFLYITYSGENSFGAGESVRIKARHGDDIRRWSTPSESVTFNALETEVQERFGVEHATLRYADEDGDLVTLGHDTDVKEWLAGAKAGQTLTIVVEAKPAPRAAPAPAPRAAAPSVR